MGAIVISFNSTRGAQDDSERHSKKKKKKARMYLGYSCYRRTEPWSIASRASTLALSLLQNCCNSTATSESNSTRVLLGPHSCLSVEIKLKMPVGLGPPVRGLPKDCLHLWSLVGPAEKPTFIFWDFRISKHLKKEIKGFGIGLTLFYGRHLDLS